MICQICGCSDEAACIGEDGQPCSWVAPGLCSACLVDEEPAEPGFCFDEEAGLWLPT